MIRRLANRHSLLWAVLLVGCTAEQIRYRPTDSPLRNEAVGASLYLLGDGGEANADRDTVLAHLSRDIESTARGGLGPPILVAFLGDNIYEEGAPPRGTDEDLEKLRGQVHAVGRLPNVRGVFLPGNHDWANGASSSEGSAAVARQREWVRDMSDGRDVDFLPPDGCPGPAAEDLAEDVRLVFIDSEWLLRSPEGPCGAADDFYRRLSAELRAHGDRRVVLLAHHPLATGGPHGGNVAPLERGPFLYYLIAKSGVIRQDLTSPAYTEMRDRLADAIEASGAPPLIHAAGHDHSLQVIRMAGPGQPRYQLVSGSVARTSHVRGIEGTRYATDGFGYMRVDFTPGGVRVAVYARDVAGGPVREVFTCALSPAASVDECPEASLAEGGA